MAKGRGTVLALPDGSPGPLAVEKQAGDAIDERRAKASVARYVERRRPAEPEHLETRVLFHLLRAPA